jgi:hypothetical protein
MSIKKQASDLKGTCKICKTMFPQKTSKNKDAATCNGQLA